ncbi:hypothetical protein [Nocardioides caricicola]|uniref:Uncharacterized protein n=1 Tax=Nocardioides caricicola TaxID=634770 RepID=A0ABW0N044_9ACTN
MQNVANTQPAQSLTSDSDARNRITSGVRNVDLTAGNSGNAAGSPARTLADVAAVAVRERSQFYAEVRADISADETLGVARIALACARDFIATVSPRLLALNHAARSAALHRLGEDDNETESDPFWAILRAMVFSYFGPSFEEPDWVPQRGVLTEQGPDMAVWMLPNGDYVCDLLVFMTPWDCDNGIWEHAAEALHAAAPALGEQLAGVRVIAPLAGYQSRYYTWDGTWEYLDDSWLSLPDGVAR